MAEFILIDWGTSNLRAYLVTDEGRVLDRRQTSDGVLAVPDRDFEATLERQIGSWMRAPSSPPVLMCGMIGSRQGWVEAPYVECPAGPDDVAGRFAMAGSRFQCRIAPGMMRRSQSGNFDVMRGEETQVFGATRIMAAAGAAKNGVYCLPGTHSKWVRTDRDKIIDFSTHMTGEVFAVLCTHSILGRTMDVNAPIDDAAFDWGFARAMEAGGLLSHLFSARANALMGELPSTAARSYLSGILIGHELRAQEFPEKPAAVTIIGDKGLTSLYERGLQRLGCATATIDAESATIAGLLALAGSQSPATQGRPVHA